METDLEEGETERERWEGGWGGGKTPLATKLKSTKSWK
jgi:hypothetical protein